MRPVQSPCNPPHKAGLVLEAKEKGGSEEHRRTTGILSSLHHDCRIKKGILLKGAFV